MMWGRWVQTQDFFTHLFLSRFVYFLRSSVFFLPKTYYNLVITFFIFMQKLAGKECDDEEECGSAADVFGNDGSGDVVTREFNKVILQRNKAQPNDFRIYYGII